MESTKKYKDLNILFASINAVIGTQETKVQKKLFKLYEKLKPYHEKYNSELEELRLDNAAVDEKNILLMDEKGGYKFNKEGVKNLTKDINALNEKEFDFNPIEVINTNGLESLTFLKDWTTGIEFIEDEEEL
jgi:phosphoribosylaminoimidazole-succinocarboxamide synthase